MTISTLAAFLAVLPSQTQTAAPDTQQYIDDQLGLSFSHPTSWVLENGQDQADAPSKGKKKARARKSKKKDSDLAEFKIPMAGSEDDADLQIMRATFTGSSDVWQALQATTNKNMKRTVERQWQQEILGVPMLLTRISYTNNGSAETTVTGLLYNDSPKKLLFRLTGPTDDFDKAQYEFTSSMESLRTTNNALPKAQDPDHPADPKPDDKGAKHAIFVPMPPPHPVLAPVTVDLVASTKHVVLRIPKEWEASHVEGSTLDLTCPGLSYPIHLSVATDLDSDPPLTALTKASGASLTDFDVVTRRDDAPVELNMGGCTVTSVWRDGTNKKGRVLSMEAAGVEGDFYFIMTCRPIPDPSYVEQRKLIEQLLKQISIEPSA